MNDELLKDLINSLNHKSENEVLELKEAKSSFKIKDLGRYFSALSNEANLKGLSSAFLAFGVTDRGDVCGTSFMEEDSMPSKGLNRLKKTIAESTNNRITFKDIHETKVGGKRVIIFEIPPATRGIPTQWAGAAWAREGESLVPLPINKIDEIRSQPPHDWSRLVVEDATIEDLDQDAIQAVRNRFREKYGEREGLVDGLDDMDLLDKAGITYRGRITNTALLLVGRPDSANLIEGVLPRITWTLYEADGTVRTYQHFGPPFLTAIDNLLKKIRNEDRIMLLDKGSIAPTTIREYDNWTLRELIGNSIAHQAYEGGGKVNVEEFPDRIVFLNEGEFIPGDLETALAPGYKPPYYRNPFLADAMLQMGLLDQNAMGIRRICEISRKRCMPLPTYKILENPQRVAVELPNRELDTWYTFILRENPDLPILTVLALDKVQKGLALTASETGDLRERGMIQESGWAVKLKASPSSKEASFFQDATADRSDQDASMPSKDGTEAATIGWRKRLSASEAQEIENVILDLLSGQSLSRLEVDDRLQQTFASFGLDVRGVNTGTWTYRALKRLEKKGLVEKSNGVTRGALWSRVD